MLPSPAPASAEAAPPSTLMGRLAQFAPTCGEPSPQHTPLSPFAAECGGDTRGPRRGARTGAAPPALDLHWLLVDQPCRHQSVPALRCSADIRQGGSGPPR
eukprot:15445746-Alexandrium_andersonii.AAC.1